MRTLAGIAAAAVLGLAANAHATMLVSWDFFGDTKGGGAAPAATTATGVQGTTLTRVNLGGGDTNSFGTDCYTVGGDGGFPTGGVNSSDYVSFTLMPTTGDLLSISDVDVSAGIQDTQGSTTGWELRSSLDGFASDLGDITGQNIDTTTISTINLTGFDNLATGVEFRLYPFGASNPYETGSLGRNDAGGADNGPGFYVDGTVTSGTPEPASMALLGLASTGLLVRRRRSVA